MAEDAGAEVPEPLLPGLPDVISIWEILLRLPPKAILRCRAVCRGWRRATSSRDFLLAHHCRQPTFPLFYAYENIYEGSNIIPFGHRAAGLTTADRLQPVARIGSTYFFMEVSCDGLLVLSTDGCFCICNPATRQYAPLPLLDGFIPMGMYLHTPTGEYRLLLYPDDKDWVHDEGPPTDEYACHVFTIGSGQPPRHIGCPDVGEIISPRVPVLFHGSLHWHTSQKIVVFDTTTESFQEMRSPNDSAEDGLFEIDGMLGMYILNYEATMVDIWVMQDYEGEVWAFKHRVELPVAEIKAQFEEFGDHWNIVVDSLDDDVLVLVRFGKGLLQLDINGKLVASFRHRCLGPSQLRLKQTLVSHTFFPTLEGYVVNAPPFI